MMRLPSGVVGDEFALASHVNAKPASVPLVVSRRRTVPSEVLGGETGTAKGRQVMANDAVAIGSGAWRYRFQRDWAKLPRWWTFGDAALPGPPRTSVKGAVAANGDVYTLCRGTHPVMVFDAEGRFIMSWGEGRFTNFVHGMTIDRAGRIWITDTGQHTVTQHEADGTCCGRWGHQAGPRRRCMANRSTCLRAWRHFERRHVRVRRIWQPQGALLLAGR